MIGRQFEEGAKAAQELAKLGTEAAKAGRDVGSFVARIFGAPLDQVSGMMADWWAYKRAAQRLDLMQRFDQKRVQLALSGPVRPVPLKFGVPLLEASALEDDDDLRDMLATLLATSTDPANSLQPRTTFVSILRDLEPLDARVLLAAYNAPPANERLYPTRTVYTATLPEAPFKLPSDRGQLVEPRPEVAIALCNLIKQGCIAPAGVWDGAITLALITVTPLGIALIDASTLPEQRTFKPPTGLQFRAAK